MNKLSLQIISLAILFSCQNATSREEERYDNGQLKSLYKLENGLRNGEGFIYYSNGSIKQKSNWKSGLKDGLTASYYKNGQINLKATFKDNFQEGWAYKYDSTGSLMGKTFYEKSVTKGPFETYFKNGTKKSLGEYLNNGTESKTYYYFEDGSPERYEYVKNDTLKYLKKYDHNGKLMTNLLPIDIQLADSQLCITLTHSMIPLEALNTCLFLQSIDDMTLNLGKQNLTSDGNTICIDYSDSTKVLEGFLCECYGDKYECMPFRYNAEKSQLDEFGPIHIP